MSSMTNYFEDAIIQFFLRDDADTYTPPATLYVALFTGAPGEAGGGTEVSGGSYARTAVALADPAGGGVTSNSADVDFPQASASWGTVTHAAIMDASTDSGSYTEKSTDAANKSASDVGTLRRMDQAAGAAALGAPKAVGSTARGRHRHCRRRRLQAERGHFAARRSRATRALTTRSGGTRIFFAAARTSGRSLAPLTRRPRMRRARRPQDASTL